MPCAASLNQTIKLFIIVSRMIIRRRRRMLPSLAACHQIVHGQIASGKSHTLTHSHSTYAHFEMFSDLIFLGYTNIGWFIVYPVFGCDYLWFQNVCVRSADFGISSLVIHSTVTRGLPVIRIFQHGVSTNEAHVILTHIHAVCQCNVHSVKVSCVTR